MICSHVVNASFGLPETPSERMLLRFEEGKASLSKNQLEALHQWVRRWLKQGKSAVLTIGGACKASRAGMLRRVHHLLQVLLGLGFCGKQIQQDDQWGKPTKMGAIDDLPPDTVWLELKPIKSND